MTEVLTQPSQDSASHPAAPAPAPDSGASTSVVAKSAANGATPPTQAITPTPPNTGAAAESGTEAGLDVGTEQQGSAPKKSREAYRARRNQALAAQVVETPAAQVVETPAAQVVETPAAQVVTPPATSPPPPSPEEEERAGANSVRLPTKDDPVAFNAALIFKQAKLSGKPITLAEAERRATVFVHGSETPEQPATAASPASPDTLEGIGEQITNLRQKLAANHQSFNFDEDAAIAEQVDELLDRRFALKHAPNPGEPPQPPDTEQPAAFVQQWNEGIATAVQMFGVAVTDPSSPLSLKAVEIQNRMKDSGDPMYHDARSATLIYIEAAKQLGAQPGSLVPPSQPAPPRPTAASLLASGAQAGGTAQTQPAGERWRPSKSRSDYNRRRAAIGL